MEPAHQITEADYLAQEGDSPIKHEFVHGELLAMAGATARHNAICGNLIGALKQRLRTRPCVVLTSDQRVHVEQTGLYAYPDLTVLCERARYHDTPAPRTLANPTVVVEVLSESTEAWDRGAKAAHYRRLATLKAYVLVSQSERRVEHYLRVEDGWLLSEVVGEGVVDFPELDCTIDLHEIYENLDLLDDAD